MMSLAVFMVISLFMGYFKNYVMVSGLMVGLMYMGHYLNSFSFDIVYVGYVLVVGGFSWFLVVLSMVLVLVVIMKKVKSNNNVVLLKGVLLILLVCCFCSDKFINFYIFFELSMMPMALMMVKYGGQPERLNAVCYMMVYTMLGSVPFLVGVFYMGDMLSSYSFILYGSNSIINASEVFWWGFGSWWVLLLILAFLVKLPVYGLHLWLPKAHVEAPVEGSVLLAGVLLKLGSFGLYMVSEGYWFNLLLWWDIAMGFFLVCLVLVGLMCFILNDFKVFVAYSSVVHMLMFIMCVLKKNKFSYMGVLSLCVSHGFCSGGLFYCVNLFYLKSCSRNINYNLGYLGVSSMLCWWWFWVCFINCSLPPSLKMVSEVICFYSLFIISIGSSMFMMLSVFLSGMFCFFLYVVVVWGGWLKKVKSNNKSNYCSDLISFVFMFYSFFFVLFFSKLVV